MCRGVYMRGAYKTLFLFLKLIRKYDLGSLINKADLISLRSLSNIQP